MVEPQDTPSSNQSDTSSDQQQSTSTSSPQPTLEPEVIFTIEDMATSNYSDDQTDVVIFTSELPSQAEE